MKRCIWIKNFNGWQERKQETNFFNNLCINLSKRFEVSVFIIFILVGKSWIINERKIWIAFTKLCRSPSFIKDKDLNCYYLGANKNRGLEVLLFFNISYSQIITSLTAAARPPRNKLRKELLRFGVAFRGRFIR